MERAAARAGKCAALHPPGRRALPCPSAALIPPSRPIASKPSRAGGGARSHARRARCCLLLRPRTALRYVLSISAPARGPSRRASAASDTPAQAPRGPPGRDARTLRRTARGTPPGLRPALAQGGRYDSVRAHDPHVLRWLPGASRPTVTAAFVQLRAAYVTQPAWISSGLASAHAHATGSPAHPCSFH